MKKKLIAVVGPTASGKTALAIEIAKKLSGEVISADSMQIYEGMDIGTAKPKASERCGVPHHMIDIVKPSTRFSVADFVKMARECIDDCHRRKVVPILAGGTGLYVDSVLNNIEFGEFGEDPSFREEMQRLATKEGNVAVHQILLEKDKKAAEKIHPNNLRRVIRALEVCHITGKTFTVVNEESRRESVYDALILGIEVDREVLYERIDRRVDIMMEEGLIDEVKVLWKSGLSKDTTAMQAIGYKEIVEYLDGKTELCQAVEKIKQESRRYAKRQLTWFRRNSDIKWVTPQDSIKKTEILRQCSEFLEE